MTGNDLGVVFYSLIFFFLFISQCCKKMQHTAKNARLYMDMCAAACASLISEKPAIVTIACSDLATKVGN